MLLAEFDARMEHAHRTEVQGRRLMSDAAKYEEETIRLAGIEHVERDPGFPCWRHKDVEGWHEGPREALEAALGKGKRKARVK